MQELTLVWNRTRCWEEEWIEYLFQNIPHKTIDNLDHTQYIDNSVIIESLAWAPYHNGYMAEMQRRGYRYGLIHLSDEAKSDDISSYAACKFVLRNHIKDGIPNHCRHFLLGYNTGFTKHTHNPSITERTHMWATIVHRWDQNRNVMAQHIQNLPNGYFYVADHHGPRLSVEDYSKVYRDSIFVLCPNGALVPDSFRITEAMEAGAIPVVQASDYWVKQYGPDFPAIIINGWEELGNKLVMMMLNPKEVAARRQLCIDWWTQKKQENLDMVTELVTRTMQ